MIDGHKGRQAGGHKYLHASAELEGNSILLVSADSKQHSKLSKIMERQGYSLTWADSTEAALQSLSARQIDCVICDSEQCIAEIRQREELEYMPIVLLSAEEIELDIYSLANGADVICQISRIDRELPKQLALLLN